MGNTIIILIINIKIIIIKISLKIVFFHYNNKFKIVKIYSRNNNNNKKKQHTDSRTMMKYINKFKV